jgi:hypothetical protein
MSDEKKLGAVSAAMLDKALPLASFIGRSFVLQGTRYAMLDGVVAEVFKTEVIPWGPGEREVLVAWATPPGEDRPIAAIVLPHQFGSEVHP